MCTITENTPAGVLAGCFQETKFEIPGKACRGFYFSSCRKVAAFIYKILKEVLSVSRTCFADNDIPGEIIFEP